MQAIEFKTTIYNGVVTLQSQYSDDWEGKSIRVIVLEDNNTENTPTVCSNTSSLFSRPAVNAGNPDFSQRF